MRSDSSKPLGADHDLQRCIEYLKTVDAPTISNAIEAFNLRPRNEGFTPCDIRCIYPELGRMCGWAVTAQVETITKAHPVGLETFRPLFEAVQNSPKPAIVAFQEIGSQPHLAAHCGEGMSTTFQRLGAAGFVTDAAVRDIPEVRALGFHYFARGGVASHGNFRVVRVGVPIHILGMVVRQGDLLHGDENGLVQIPAECLGRLQEEIEAIRTKEGGMFNYIRSSEFKLEELLRRFYH